MLECDPQEAPQSWWVTREPGAQSVAEGLHSPDLSDPSAPTTPRARLPPQPSRSPRREPRWQSSGQGHPPSSPAPTQHPKEHRLPGRGVASLSAQPDSPRFAGVENNGFKLCREELVPAL